MDTVRDLARVDPWQESFERSLARRRKVTRPPIQPHELEPERDVRHDDRSVRRHVRDLLVGWRAASRCSKVLVVSAGIFTLSLLAAVLPSMSDGRAARASATAGHATPSRAAASPTAGSVRAAPDSDAGVATGTGTCRPVAQSSGYVNPLAAATVTPERIDQGVDYAGSGTLTAIGAVTVTYVSTSDTGWPGAFIEYQLLGGPDVGCYVFYAEGVRPAPGLRVGETVRAGQTLANIIPHYSSGIEIGWGAGVDTKTYAATVGTWTASDDADNVATAAGKSFSALIAVLGGPPGKVEG